MEAQSECAKYKQVLEQLKANGVDVPSLTTNIAEDLEEGGVIETYVSQIATLELENKRLRDTMQSLQTSPGPSTPGVSFGTGSFAPFPELEEVDEQLEHDALIAAEEETYR